jgi:hypothetical protein
MRLKINHVGAWIDDAQRAVNFKWIGLGLPLETLA